MAARLTRAKKRLASSGIPFATPPAARLDERLDVVATVVYLAFTSGYHPGDGDVPLRVDLGDEAIRLLRVLDSLLPDRPVVRALLALLLLQHSRRDTRLAPDGTPDPAARPGPLPLAPRRDRRGHRRPRVPPVRPCPGRTDPTADPVDPPTRRPPPSSPASRRSTASRRSSPPSTPPPRPPPTPAGTSSPASTSSSNASRARRSSAWPARSRSRRPPVPTAGLLLLDGLEDSLPRHHRVPAVRAELLVRAGNPTAAATAYREALDAGHQPDGTHPPGVPPGRAVPADLTPPSPPRHRLESRSPRSSACNSRISTASCTFSRAADLTATTAAGSPSRRAPDRARSRRGDRRRPTASTS